MKRGDRVQVAVVWGGTAAIIAGLWILCASFRSQLWDYPYNVPPGDLSLGQLILIPVAILTAITLAGFSTMTWRLAKERRVRRFERIGAQAWALFLIAGGIALVGVSAQYQFDTWLFNSGPYITWTGTQDPTTGMTVNWYTGLPEASTVRYGTSPGNLSMVLSNGWLGQFHSVSLDGLQPNTTYYYVAGSNALKQFTTAPVGTHAFTFAAWADPRQNDPLSAAMLGPNLPAIMDSILRVDRGIDPAFSVCLGDITSRGVDYETWALWFEDIATADWATNRSHQIAIGNHERHDDCIAKNFARHYPYEMDERGQFYYAFTYGHVRFIMLDPWNTTTCWFGGMTATQLAWAEAELAAAEASATFTIIGVHPDPRSGGGHHGDLLQAQFAGLLASYRVDLVLCGHTHDYWRSTVDDTTFIRMGIGGNVYSRVSDFMGFSLVSVNETAIRVESIHVNGTIFDTATITA